MTLFRILVGLTLLSGSTFSTAQQPIDGPVTVIVNSAAGGPVDLVIRAMKDEFSEALGQPVVLENRAGGGGVVGATNVARASPNGRTLLFSGNGPLTAWPILYPDTPYAPLLDFELVTLVADVPVIFSINAKVPAQNTGELVQLAKGKPESLNFGSAGIGTPAHLGVEYFKILTGIQMVHVPFNGAGQAVASLLAGDIQLYIGTPSFVLQHAQQGKLRLLMVSGDKRLRDAPEVPTFAEAGVPTLTVPAWYGILGPRGIPRPIVEAINAAAQRALQKPKVQDTLAKAYFNVIGKGPDEFRNHLVRELEVTRDIIAKAGIKAPPR